MRAHPKTNPTGLTRDETIDKLICNLTDHGEKHKAEAIVRGALLLLKEDIIKDSDCKYYDQGITAKGVLHAAIENSRPLVSVSREKRGASVVMKPKAILYSKQQIMAVKFLSKYILNKRLTGKFLERTVFDLLKKAYRR